MALRRRYTLPSQPSAWEQATAERASILPRAQLALPDPAANLRSGVNSDACLATWIGTTTAISALGESRRSREHGQTCSHPPAEPGPRKVQSLLSSTSSLVHRICHEATTMTTRSIASARRLHVVLRVTIAASSGLKDGVLAKAGGRPEIPERSQFARVPDRVPKRGVTGGGTPRSPARAGLVSWR